MPVGVCSAFAADDVLDLFGDGDLVDQFSARVEHRLGVDVIQCRRRNIIVSTQNSPDFSDLLSQCNAGCILRCDLKREVRVIILFSTFAALVVVTRRGPAFDSLTGG